MTTRRSFIVGLSKAFGAIGIAGLLPELPHVDKANTTIPLVLPKDEVERYKRDLIGPQPHAYLDSLR